MKIVASLLLSLLAKASADFITPIVSVNYTQEGVDLEGYLAVPEAATGPLPAVVLIPDWDGVNDYEKQRAQFVAEELGFVGFAADIYGTGLHEVENMTLRVELATLYRSNSTLFATRIQAAVDAVRMRPEVDGSKVALAGFCFGGTGVIMYALEAINDVLAIVSFHGGLGMEPQPKGVITPKILILSGGADDTSTEIMDLEMTLDAGNGTWQITRFSGVEHAFTVWEDERYHEFADMRSWTQTLTFLQEAFGEVPYESEPPAMIDVMPVHYVDVDGAELRGYLAVPGDEWVRPLPAAIIVPDWDGVNTYEKQRATLLAEQGYYAMAIDIFGANLQENLTMDQRINNTVLYRSNQTLFVQRMETGLSQLKMVEGVDTENIGAMGYCFGGTGMIQLAFSGNDEVKIVTSFHGGLTSLPEVTTPVYPYVQIESGGIDDAHGNQTELEAALNAANASWEISRYSGVDHGFTDWAADAYSLTADARSWDSMLALFQELMVKPMMAEDSGSDTSSAAAFTGVLATAAAVIHFIM